MGLRGERLAFWIRVSFRSKTCADMGRRDGIEELMKRSSAGLGFEPRIGIRGTGC